MKILGRNRSRPAVADAGEDAGRLEGSAQALRSQRTADVWLVAGEQVKSFSKEPRLRNSNPNKASFSSWTKQPFQLSHTHFAFSGERSRPLLRGVSGSDREPRLLGQGVLILRNVWSPQSLCCFPSSPPPPAIRYFPASPSSRLDPPCHPHVHSFTGDTRVSRLSPFSFLGWLLLCRV